MNLIDATLDLARFIGDVYRGVATGGNTSCLTDSNNPNGDGYYDGGTIWILTGNLAGKALVIDSYILKTFNFADQDDNDGATDENVYADDQYAVINNAFPLPRLKEAINQLLVYFPTEKYDETLTVDVGNSEYTLPTGVRNIKKVEIATFLEAPYGYAAIPWWREINGKLEIQNGIFLDDEDHKIRLTYSGYHGEVDDDDPIDPRIPPEYLRYAGTVWLWRNYIQRIENDSPISREMFNEAKMLEAEAKMKAYHMMPVVGRDAKGAVLP